MSLRSVLLAALALIVLMGTRPADASVFDELLGRSDGPLPVEEAYRFSYRELAPGLIELNWQIEPGYYLYRDRIIFHPDEQVTLVEERRDPAKPKEDAIYGSTWVYYEQAQVLTTLRSTAAEDAGSAGVLKLEYQGCWEGGICYPPVTTEVALSALPAAAPPLPGGATGGGAAPGGVDPSQAGAQARVLPVPAGAALSEQDQFALALQGGNLLLTLLLFFGAGLGLALTPCVFPMIPILSSVIVGQGQPVSTRKAFALSLVYVLAMSLTYTVAGVLAGLFGDNLQAAFQNAWIISAFSLVFVALSLSMFGFYELQLPVSWQSRLGALSRSQHGGQVLGVGVMGFLSALIVGPCVAAPLAGALLYIGQTGDPLLGGLALFILSLGMGAPLLVVGTSAGRWLPKAGGWMNHVKAGFGVIMLLMAVWMLDRIVPPLVTMLLTGTILVITAIFLHALDGLPYDAGNVRRFWKGIGILLLIYGSSVLIGAAAGNRSLVYPLQGIAAVSGPSQAGRAVPPAQLPFTEVTTPEALDQVLASSRSEGVPVMLDFYADWCVSCKEIELFLFADAAVQREFERYRLVRVDVTANDEAARHLSRTYQLIGPPALIFYDKQGELQPAMTLIGVPDSDEFVGHLKRL